MAGHIVATICPAHDSGIRDHDHQQRFYADRFDAIDELYSEYALTASHRRMLELVDIVVAPDRSVLWLDYCDCDMPLDQHPDSEGRT